MNEHWKESRRWRKKKNKKICVQYRLIVFFCLLFFFFSRFLCHSEWQNESFIVFSFSFLLNLRTWWQKHITRFALITSNKIHQSNLSMSSTSDLLQIKFTTIIRYASYTWSYKHVVIFFLLFNASFFFF